MRVPASGVARTAHRDGQLARLLREALVGGGAAGRVRALRLSTGGVVTAQIVAWRPSPSSTWPALEWTPPLPACHRAGGCGARPWPLRSSLRACRRRPRRLQPQPPSRCQCSTAPAARSPGDLLPCTPELRRLARAAAEIVGLRDALASESRSWPAAASDRCLSRVVAGAPPPPRSPCCPPRPAPPLARLSVSTPPPPGSAAAVRLRRPRRLQPRRRRAPRRPSSAQRRRSAALPARAAAAGGRDRGPARRAGLPQLACRRRRRRPLPCLGRSLGAPPAAARLSGGGPAGGVTTGACPGPSDGSALASSRPSRCSFPRTCGSESLSPHVRRAP